MNERSHWSRPQDATHASEGSDPQFVGRGVESDLAWARNHIANHFAANRVMRKEQHAPRTPQASERPFIGGGVEADLEWARGRIANHFAGNRIMLKRQNEQGPTAKPAAPALEAHGGARDAPNADEPVAELDVCADTESADRTKLTMAELQAAQVGHAWVKLRPTNPAKLPKSLPAPTAALMRAGGTALGFWPLVFRPYMFNIEAARARFGPDGDAMVQQTEARLAAGQTPGVGASPDPSHRGFSKNPLDSWVPGRVEEPDDAHQPKAKLTFRLSAAQLESLMTYVNSKRTARYSLFFFNCTTFAVEAARAAGQNPPSGAMFGAVCLPNALYKGILEEKEKGNPDAATKPLGLTPDGRRETRG